MSSPRFRAATSRRSIVARWLEAGVDLLILEEPTFGVDVGSKAEIYRLLQEALDKGLAVLLISSDFEEVAGICHRAIILDRGQFVAELPRTELSIARLTAMTSGAEERKCRRGWHEHARDDDQRARLWGGASILLRLEPRDLVGAADRRLLDPEGRHVPHRLHLPVDDEQPLHQRAWWRWR